MATDAVDDFSRDILDLGHLVSKMLRANTVARSQKMNTAVKY